jgi:AraC family transcriptional regulator
MISNNRHSWAAQSRLRSVGDAANEVDGRSALRKSEVDGASEEMQRGTALLPHAGVPSEAVRVANDICQNVQRNPESARAAALELVLLLTRHPVTARGGLAPWQKRKVEQYVHEHLQEDVRVGELANMIPLSVSYFYRAFKQTFGETPRAYLTRRRLELAQELMLCTQEPLTRIAIACGFADQSHLSKAFRRVMTETPSTWRRRNFDDGRVDASTRRRSAGALR